MTMFVSHNGNFLSMNPKAMEALGWTNGQRITEDQVFEGIAANARQLCLDNHADRLAGKPAVDTSKLEAMLGLDL